MKAFLAVLLCLAGRFLSAQVNTGELRLKIADANGLGLQADITLASEANHYFIRSATNDQGFIQIRTLPYGVYLMKIEKAGFSSSAESLEIRSAIPVEKTGRLTIAPLNTIIKVSGASSLIEPGPPVLHHADWFGADRR